MKRNLLSVEPGRQPAHDHATASRHTHTTHTIAQLLKRITDSITEKKEVTNLKLIANTSNLTKTVLICS